MALFLRPFVPSTVAPSTEKVPRPTKRSQFRESSASRPLEPPPLPLALTPTLGSSAGQADWKPVKWEEDDASVAPTKRRRRRRGPASEGRWSDVTTREPSQASSRSDRQMIGSPPDVPPQFPPVMPWSPPPMMAPSIGNGWHGPDPGFGSSVPANAHLGGCPVGLIPGLPPPGMPFSMPGHSIGLPSPGHPISFPPPGPMGLPLANHPFTLPPHLSLPAYSPSTSSSWSGQEPVGMEDKAKMPKGPPPKWLELEETAPFVKQGLPQIVPVVTFDAFIQNVSSELNYILYELAGGEVTDLDFRHDHDWSQYPEVAKAITQAGCEEISSCIVISKRLGMWAVGLAAGWKNRERAAKLAFCLALAANADSLKGVCSAYPAFKEILDDAGVCTDEMPRPPELPPPAIEDRDPLDEAFNEEKFTLEKPAEAPLTSAPATETSLPMDPYRLPRDVPIWIRLDDDKIPAALSDFQPEGLVVACDGASRRTRAIYSHADSALSSLLGDLAKDVQFLDDVIWDKLPGIGAALKKLAKEEECFTVAVCAPLELWAVGVSMKGAKRWMAAKAALAARVAMQLQDMGEDLPDLSDFPDLKQFVKEARAARPAPRTAESVDP